MLREPSGETLNDVMSVNAGLGTAGNAHPGRLLCENDLPKGLMNFFFSFISFPLAFLQYV